MAEHLRRVIREHRFERELRALIHDAIGADKFVEAAEFLLVRDPEIGFELEPGSLIWFCRWPQSKTRKFLSTTRSMNRLSGSFRSREFSQPICGQSTQRFLQKVTKVLT